MPIESISCEQTVIKFNLNRAGEAQAFLVASIQSPADAAQAAGEAYDRIAETLRDHGLEIMQERIFGSLPVERSVMAARHRAFQTYSFASDNPVTYIEGNPPWGDGLAGVIIHAVSLDHADDVWTIMDGVNPCGRGWRHNGLTHLVLQNIQGINGHSRSSHLSNAGNAPQPPLKVRGGKGGVMSSLQAAARPLQTRQMLDRAERILRENGASYRDVARTWFYLSDILDWYAEFNKVRNEKYGEFGIMPGPGDRDLLLPASTGIRGETPSGAAATMDLVAITGEADSRPVIKQLTNAAQLDAFRYGSAFSRGALIQEPDVSLIEASGTAAIDQQGKSQFHGNIRGQIACTFDRIETLLGQAGASLRDIAAATVFVKRPEYVEIFRVMARERGLEEFPAVCVVADVCREELLFEIDAEVAVRKESA
jgi:enamine deaminase RidA (YjgF/YER057c/UK114 family)